MALLNREGDGVVLSSIYSRTDPRAAQLANQIGPKSVITYPSGGHTLQGPGFYEISGLAWSGAGAVRDVEVSTDGGQSWKAADLRSPVFRIAHTRFAFPWKWDGKPCTLLSRCTDELGTRQPSREEAGKYFNDPPDRTRIRGNDNSIQPWKVAADGSVTNGLA
jgi:sulfane dehydrogenase subunit SoxC